MNIILIFLLSVGCVTNTYNTPFVNTNETTMLNFGMSRDDVLSVMNEPLFVAYGDKNEIIWVYEVRTIEVNSSVTPSGKVIPEKTSPTTKHAGPVHKLALTFENDQLAHWEPYNEAN